jgi:hypothetical protein
MRSLTGVSWGIATRWTPNDCTVNPYGSLFRREMTVDTICSVDISTIHRELLPLYCVEAELARKCAGAIVGHPAGPLFAALA